MRLGKTLLMCPIHWAMLALVLIPTGLGVLGYLGFRMTGGA
jgi:hypothetical protein